MIFLDTSAIYALADVADPEHDSAKERFEALLSAWEALLTHNYVLVESIALIQNRLGLDAAIKFIEDARLFEVQWVEERIHNEAVRRLRASRRRRLSLVDHVSFLVMRARGITTAFALDRHFADEGFQIFKG